MKWLFRVEFESDIPEDRFEEWADANLLPREKLQVFDKKSKVRVFKR